jgi:hypothetical protein
VNAQVGQNLVVMPTASLKSGVYMIEVSVNGAKQVKRLVIR